MESSRWRLSSLASTLFIVASIISLSSAVANPGEDDASEIIGREGTVSRFLRTTRRDGTTGHAQHEDGQFVRTLNVFDHLAAATTSTSESTNTAVDEDAGPNAADIHGSDNIFTHSISQQQQQQQK